MRMPQAAYRCQKTYEAQGYKVCAFGFLTDLAAFQEKYCNMAVSWHMAINLFPGKNAFWNQSKSLKNDSEKLFVT